MQLQAAQAAIISQSQIDFTVLYKQGHSFP